MASFNKVIIAGNMTRDIEVRYTPGGAAVGEFGLACNRKWFDKNTQQQKDETTFIDVTAWGKSAETLAQYTHKGSNILIEGRLKLDQWEDKATGARRSKLSVVCENFQFLDKKSQGDPSQQNQGYAAPQAQNHPPANAPHQPQGPQQAAYGDPSSGQYDQMGDPSQGHSGQPTAPRGHAPDPEVPF